MARTGGRGPGGGSNRAAILGAAYVAIAELGYRGATTAEICRRAGVSSGTFFHYFPTKERLLLDLLAEPDEAASDADSAPAGAIPVPGDPAPHGSAVGELLDEVVEECADPHLPAFVREVSTLESIPRVAEVLGRSAERRHRRLVGAVEADRRAGRCRTDLPAAEVARRLDLLLDGFESAVASGAGGPAAPGFEELAASLRGAAGDVVRAPASGADRG